MSNINQKISLGLLIGLGSALVILIVVCFIVDEGFSERVFDRVRTHLRIVWGR